METGAINMVYIYVSFTIFPQVKIRDTETKSLFTETTPSGGYRNLRF